MNREEFYNYIMENFMISEEATRLIGNILYFVENNYPYEHEQQYNVLDELSYGTIGLTSEELMNVHM